MSLHIYECMDLKSGLEFTDIKKFQWYNGICRCVVISNSNKSVGMPLAIISFYFNRSVEGPLGDMTSVLLYLTVLPPTILFNKKAFQ